MASGVREKLSFWGGWVGTHSDFSWEGQFCATFKVGCLDPEVELNKISPELKMWPLETANRSALLGGSNG